MSNALVTLCIPCALIIRVIGDAGELDTLVGSRSEWWPDRYPCVRCWRPCSALAELEAERQRLVGPSTQELSPQEYFQALQGLGLPEERKCSRREVEGLLRAQKIKRLAGHDVSSNRFCLEWLELEDGSRLYFGASSHGAIIYKITAPPNFANRVLQEIEEEDRGPT